MRITLIVLAILMAVTIYVSNQLVESFIIDNWVTWATITFPLAFLITDLSNRWFGANAARLVMLAGFAVGVFLSIQFGDVRIGIASGTAFLVGQLLDISIFDRLRSAAVWKAPVISSFVASLFDTALFYYLAFGAVPFLGWAAADWPWFQVGVADFGVKIAMALVLLPAYLALVSAFRPSKD